MKNILAILVLLLIVGCGKKEETKLQLFSPMVGAYDMGDGAWEVNATMRVKGFQQKEDNGNFSMNVTFKVMLVSPSGEKKEVFKGAQQMNGNEKMMDQPLEAQFELDSTYARGKYKVIFDAVDELSKQTVSAEKELELGEDQ